MVHLKICGITNLKDALKAVELGVEVLGFIFAPSPRKVSPEVAQEIIRKLPPFVVPVGVFVDQAQETVKEIARVCALQVLQFHGNEPPAYLHSFPQRIIKTISVKDENSLQTMASYQSLVSAYLLDTYVKGKVGGTGRVFNWNLAILAKKFGPIILAGGITPDNVQEAIKKVKPYGIDVCSGVEKSPGKKDPRKLEILVRKVREINF